MALQAVVKSIDGLDESVKALYKKEGDVFVLDLEGADDLPSVRGLKNAFDATKTDKQRLKTLLEQYGDLTPEEAKKLAEEVRKHKVTLSIRGKPIKTEEDVVSIVEELLQERVGEATKAWETERSGLQKSLEKERSLRAAREIDATILASATKAGVRETATADVLNRARGVWQLSDDGIVAKDGEKVLYSGRDPNKPMSPDEWVEKLSQSAPHLFNTSGGGGSGGGDQGGRSTVNGKQVITQQQLAAGTVPLEKIASGEVVIEGTVQ